VTFRFVIRPTAEQDMEEASAWHERRQVGLGRQFIACVDQTIQN
jgi:hypothetical protein